MYAAHNRLGSGQAALWQIGQRAESRTLEQAEAEGTEQKVEQQLVREQKAEQ